jgi:hypothetical protein
MIPSEHRDDIIQTGLTFMRAITEAYGSDEGLKLWDTIASTLDPDVKGQIFFAMLTGAMPGRIRVVGVNVGSISRKVEQIKAIRHASGWGLKESKDAVDDLITSNKPIVFECNPDMRSHYAEMLRQTGLYC